MELVAMELKQSGYFLARTLSYEVSDASNTTGLFLLREFQCKAFY